MLQLLSVILLGKQQQQRLQLPLVSAAVAITGTTAAASHAFAAHTEK